jgi:hypothetical protein
MERKLLGYGRDHAARDFRVNRGRRNRVKITMGLADNLLGG